MADSTRLLSETIVVTLTLTEDISGVDTAITPDATPTAEICVHAQLVETITAAEVSNPSAGVYTFSFTPTKVGLHVVEWSWTYGEVENTSEFQIDVEADPLGTVTDDAAEAAVAATSLAADKLCVVTSTFYDGSGNALQGIVAKFTPLRSTDAFLTSGVIVQEVQASSDADGALALALVRGIMGTLAITHIGIVRQVTVPDAATTTLEDLVALGDDLLEVQVPQFTKLPRRST